MYGKYIVCLCACLLTTGAVWGQKFHGGGRLAIQFTQVDGDDLGGYNKVGLLTGGFANVSFLNERIKLQIELNYAQKGSKSTTENHPNNIPYRLDIHQIELPVLFGWNIWKGFWIEAGPSFNFNFLTVEKQNSQKVESNPGAFRLFVLEGVAGIGYAFKGHLMLYGRFGYSFTPVAKMIIDRNNTRLWSNAYNNVLQFGFAYQF
jgi:hypothetical protein